MPPTTTDEATTRFVINALSQHRSRNEIVMEVCQRLGLTWPAAERFVAEVELQHGRSIAARQSPLIIILGLTSIIVGACLAGSSLLYFLSYLWRDGWQALLGLRSLYFQIGALVTGTGMVLGGLWGSWKTIRQIITGQ